MAQPRRPKRRAARRLPRTPLARWLVGRLARHIVEVPAALLVVAEIVVLFAGVVSRYVLARAAGLVGRTGLDPVPLAGDARRGHRAAARRAHAHDRAGGARRRRACARCLEAIATCAALAFLLLMVAWPACEYASDETLHHHAGAARFPTPGAPRRCPVGIALMALFALLRLLAHGELRTASRRRRSRLP